ncbi:MAG: zinc ribbon domain-containing protein [Anaerolineae bacterium]
MSERKTYEMLWDCKFCGTKKNLGKTHRHCPNCGAAQDPSWRYYPSDEEKIAVEDHQYVGADVICPACSTPNSAAANNCMQCGAPLAEGKRASALERQRKNEGEAFQADDLQARLRQTNDAAVGRAPAQTPAKAGGIPWLPIVIGIVALLLCGGIIFAVTYTRSTNVYVTGHEWSREIRIEQYSSISENNWCDSMPAGAYSVRRTQEQRSSRQVPDGEDCHTERQDNGDGTFSEERVCETRYRSEPVYDDMCYYNIDRWVYTRSATADGDSVDDRITWPDTNISRNCNNLGCEREQQRIETYTLQLRGSGDANYACPVDFDLWDATGIEDAFTLNVGVLGDARCDSLERAG